MANRTVELQIKLQNAQSISELEGVLKEINKDLKEVDVNSSAFTELSEVAKRADGQLKSIREDLRGISDEKQIASTFKTGEALAGAFTVATVASSAFGEQTSKSIQEGIQKATALTAILQGLKPITEALSAGNRQAFAAMIKGLRESAAGAAFFGTSLRTALSLTGIGLFIAALGTLITYWDDLKKSIGLVNEEQETYFRKQQQNAEITNRSLKEIIKSSEFEIELLKAKGEQQDVLLRKQIELAKVEKQLAENSLKPVREEYQRLLIQMDNLSVAMDNASEVMRNQARGSLDELKKKVNDTKVQYDGLTDAVTSADNKIKILEATLSKFNQDEAKKSAEERKKQIDKAIDDEAKALNKKYQQQLEQEQLIIQQAAELRKADGVNIEEEEKERLNKQLERLGEAHRSEFEQLKEAENAKLELKREKSAEELAIEQERFQNVLGNINAFTQLSLDAFNSISAAISDNIRTQIDSLNLQLDIITERYDEKINDIRSLESLLSETRGEAHEQLLSQIAEERKEEKKLVEEKKKIQNQIIAQQNKQNEVQWRNSLINSIVQTALGVTNALGSSAPPVNFIMAALVGVLGAVQQGIILGNKPEPIPGLARGGFTGAGTIRDGTGERQTGLAMLHENEWVAPRWMVENSKTGSIIQQLEAIRSARPMAEGGFSTEAFPAISPDYSAINSLTAFSLKSAIESANIYVSVQEINDVNTNVTAIESRIAA